MEKWIIQWIRKKTSAGRTDLLLQNIDGPAEFIKLLDIFLYLINTIYDSGMISLAQGISDGVKRHIGHIAAQIHNDLPGLDDLGIALGSLDVLHRDIEMLCHCVDDQF